MPTSLNQVYEAIGSLKSDVRNLTQLIEAQDRRSSESRKRTHDRLDGLSEKVGGIDDRLVTQERVIKDIEPLARDFGTVRDRSKTVFAVIIGGWTLLAGLLMWLGNNILEWIVHRLGGQ